jgi:murein DD-endopeptidase MepM/ murein hydrolase activator NlpD
LLLVIALAAIILVAMPTGARSTTVDVPVYRPPLAGAPVVVHPFDAPATPWAPGHRGVDLQAGAGTPVLAPAPGIVTFAGLVAGRPVLTLTHPDGLRSSLEPVEPAVPVGTSVVAGQVVGMLVDSPASHCAPAACLHWGVRQGSTYLDPWSLLVGPGPIVLLAGPPDQQTRSASRI